MESSNPSLEQREEVWYVKGETEPFTGTQIWYNKDGSKYSETPYMDGKKHGTVTDYYRDGTKKWETP